MIALRRASVALICALVVMLSGPVSAQTDTTILAPSTNDIHEFTRLLADARVQEWLLQQAEGAETNTPIETLSVRDQLDALVLRTQDRIAALVRTWEGLGQAPELMQGRWREQVTDDRRVQSLTFVLIFLFLGAGLEWLFRQYSNPMRRRLEISQFKTPSKRITAAVTRAGLALAGLLAFAVGSIGAFSAFDWPPILFALILNLLMAIVVIRVVGTTLLLFLAPYVPRLRLVPVSTGLARLISRAALAFATVLVVAIAFRDVFAQVIEVFKPQGGDNALLAVSVMLAGVVSMTALLCLHTGFFLAARQNPQAGSKSARKWRGFLSLLIVLSLTFWILDLRPMMWSVLCVGLLIVSLKLLRAWVDHAFDNAIADHLAKLPHRPSLRRPKTS